MDAEQWAVVIRVVGLIDRFRPALRARDIVQRAREAM